MLAPLKKAKTPTILDKDSRKYVDQWGSFIPSSDGGLVEPDDHVKYGDNGVPLDVMQARREKRDQAYAKADTPAPVAPPPPTLLQAAPGKVLSDPPPPQTVEAAKPLAIPTIISPTVVEAKKKSLLAQKKRTGRKSTILTNMDPLG